MNIFQSLMKIRSDIPYGMTNLRKFHNVHNSLSTKQMFCSKFDKKHMLEIIVPSTHIFYSKENLDH